MDTAKRPR
jgi:RNA-directed DNA polymerase